MLRNDARDQTRRVGVPTAAALARRGQHETRRQGEPVGDVVERRIVARTQHLPTRPANVSLLPQALRAAHPAAMDPNQVATFPDEPVPLPSARVVASTTVSVIQAARTGNLRMLQRHLEQPAANVNRTYGEQGATLLLLAAREAPAFHPRYAELNANAAIRYLLRRGANANAPDALGYTPLYEVTKRGPPHFDALRALLQAGAHPSLACKGAHVRNADDATVLHMALRKYASNPAPVLQELLNAGADPNEVSNKGLTPLFLAARYCTDPAPAIVLLLAAGAQPDVASVYNIPSDDVEQPSKTASFGTPLVALLHYSPNPLPAMRMLVAAGADLRQARSDYANVVTHGDTLRSPNDIEHLFRDLSAPASSCMMRAEPDGAKRSMSVGSTQIEGIEKHTVWTAAAAGRDDIIVWFMTHRPGVFGHVSDKRQQGPATFVLAHAAMGKTKDSFEVLKRIVAALPALREQVENPGPGFDINAIDDKGMSALLHGIEHDSQRAVHHLLANGADPTRLGPKMPKRLFRKTQHWENALMFAIGAGRASCTRSILDWYLRNPLHLRILRLDKVEKAITASLNSMTADFGRFKVNARKVLSAPRESI